MSHEVEHLKGMALRIVAGIFLVSGVAWSKPSAPRPHIVLIVADDLGWGDVSWHGGEARMPNLAKLAASGARLEQFYALPSCTPTRAALMTGRYPMRYGLQTDVIQPWSRHGLPLTERTIAQALKRVGYETAIVGKWHLGHFERAYLPTQRGFDRQYGSYGGSVFYFSHTRSGKLDWHRNDEVNQDQGYATQLIGRETAEIVRHHDKSRPLFLYVPFTAPHLPYEVPPQYLPEYSRFAEPKRTYFAMLTALDEAVGQIVGAIDERGMRSQTLFLFTSDNGGEAHVANQGPFRGAKGRIYEGGVRVPAFAAWRKKIREGSEIQAPLHTVDLFATLLKLAGSPDPAPRPLDGLDVWPVIAGGAPAPFRDILIDTQRTRGALRSGDWKIVINGHEPIRGEWRIKARIRRFFSRNKLELFNLKEDPGESTNLATKFPEKLNELLGAYQAYAKQASPALSRPKARLPQESVFRQDTL